MAARGLNDRGGILHNLTVCVHGIILARAGGGEDKVQSFKPLRIIRNDSSGLKKRCREALNPASVVGKIRKLTRKYGVSGDVGSDYGDVFLRGVAHYYGVQFGRPAVKKRAKRIFVVGPHHAKVRLEIVINPLRSSTVPFVMNCRDGIFRRRGDDFAKFQPVKFISPDHRMRMHLNCRDKRIETDRSIGALRLDPHAPISHGHDWLGPYLFDSAPFRKDCHRMWGYDIGIFPCGLADNRHPHVGKIHFLRSRRHDGVIFRCTDAAVAVMMPVQTDNLRLFVLPEVRLNLR